MEDNQIINKTLNINAHTSRVWKTLTDPELLKLWMLDSEINISSDWKAGSPIMMYGDLHGIRFETKGMVLQAEPEKILEYTHWSSLSQHADIPENYSVITFMLTPIDGKTILTFTQSNFETEVSYKHFNFYWNVALELMKKLNEDPLSG
ncbi:MAG TPA: SRPBCC domain-containing protein [Flavipsychrobacter sp.]|nr:SRPBCC domain-containing protein [Flavipsychrobacter sp.]